ncbi:hypothetical protein Tco_1479548, partial [Tanacetum coccineum]
GALIHEVMTNQKMRNSHAYKTYLAYATRATTPKKERKFKKPATPSKKRTLVIVEVEEPEPAKRRHQLQLIKIKGIDLLSDVAALEATQLKKVIKRSKHDTSIHQAGGSGNGTGSKPGVLGEPKGKSIDTNEGSGLKPGLPDVSKADSFKNVHDSDDDPQQADDERTDFENQETNDDQEESDDEFVHTPLNYVPTDDEMNDESNDVDEEEYDRIEKELYGDVNVRLADVEQVDEGEEDANMTHVAHVQNATTEVPLFSSSHSVSSNCTIAFLNFENIHSTKPEVVSILDINVQHEVPHTSPLLTIPVSVIHEHTIFNPSEIVATASATTISSQLSSLFPFLQQSTLIPTPTTTEATTSTTVVPDSETLTALHQRIDDLEKDVKELKDVDNSTKVISIIKSEVPNVVKEYLGSSLDDALHKVIQRSFADIIKEHSVLAEIVERLRQQYAPQKSIKDIREIKMEHARKQQVPKETITSSVTTALEEFDQKTTLFETMTKSKSFNKSPKHIALYHALMESILEDEKAMDKGVVDELKKRKQDDTDKDEGPSAGSDQGLKR